MEIKLKYLRSVRLVRNEYLVHDHEYPLPIPPAPKGFIYLGGAYSGAEESNYELHCAVAAAIAREGTPIYAPIVSWHPVAVVHKLPGDYNFWEKQDTTMLHNALALWIIETPDWMKSNGVRGEVNTMLFEQRAPVYLLSWDYASR